MRKHYDDDDLDIVSKNDSFLIEEDEEEEKKDFLTPILILAAIGIFAFSGYKIGSALLGYHEADVEYETVSGDFTDYIGDERVNTTSQKEVEEKSDEIQQIVEEAEAAEDPESLYPLKVDHASLKEQNSDYIGWLYFQNGGVSYPIVQDDGTGKYLKTTFEGKKNSSGAIFINSEASKDFTDLNTIVYGHNMKNGGMFGSLKNLYNTPSTLVNPYFFIETESKLYTYKVFAIIKTTNTSSFYSVPQNNAAYENYINELSATASYFDAKAPGLSSHKPIIMFSTCYGAQGTSNRLLVFGVLQESD